MSLNKYAHLIKCKMWRRNWNKRKYVPRIQFSFSKNEHQNEGVWLIHLKGAVKYQCSDIPRHATLDVSRSWFVLTRRKRRVRNTTPYDTSRFLTRRVPIQDSPCRGISRSRKFHEIAHFTQWWNQLRGFRWGGGFLRLNAKLLLSFRPTVNPIETLSLEWYKWEDHYFLEGEGLEAGNIPGKYIFHVFSYMKVGYDISFSRVFFSVVFRQEF